MGETVYVVDDDQDLRGSLARLLSRQGFSAASFADPADMLAAHDCLEPCCVVSDIMMGDIDGLEFARRLRFANPAAAFVFVTAWPRTADAVEAVRDLKGFAYLEKPLDQSALIEAVDQATRWSRRHYEAAARLAQLSPRERQVFNLVATGRSSKAIAGELGISLKTVEDHRAALIRKTNASNLADLSDLYLSLKE